MKEKSVIKQIFCGERGTFDEIKLSEQYKKAESEMYAAVDAFLEKLTDEQKEAFDNAYDYIADKSAEYAADHFTEGFKLGLLVGIEAAE